MVIPQKRARVIVDTDAKNEADDQYAIVQALLMEPRINTPKIHVVWIGGAEWPVVGAEYNLSNDIHAANVVMRSQVEVWQIPSSVYRAMPVSYAELYEKVFPHG